LFIFLIKQKHKILKWKRNRKRKKTRWLLVGRLASKFSVERGCASVRNRRKTRQIGNSIFFCMSIGIVQVKYYTLSCNYRITANIWDSNIGRNSQIQSTEITEPPYLYFPKYLNHGQEFVFYLCYFLSDHVSIPRKNLSVNHVFARGSEHKECRLCGLVVTGNRKSIGMLELQI
jgi:hypothetical protein